MKKYLNIFFFTFFSILITSCGGVDDDFSGDYNMVMTTNNALMDSAMGLDKEYKIKISVSEGFMENEGKRQLFEKIFIRESDGKDYLIFKQGSKEEAFTIVDKDTLTNTEGNMTSTLTRI